jgi:WD40 repeat protein
VSEVRFSPDGRRLASSDNVHFIRTWEVETGRPERVIGPLQHTTHTLRFHPEEETIVSGHADGGIRYWSVDTGQLLRTTSGPTPEGDADRNILALEFSGQGDVLRGIGRDGVHEFTAREPVPGVREHRRTAWPYVYGVTFSPSGRHLLSAGWDGKIRVWDTETRQPVTVLESSNAGYWSRYSRDGRRLLVGSMYTRHVKIVSLRDPVTFETLNELRGHTYLALGAFAPRADTVLVGVSSELWFADPETLAVREKRPIPGDMSAMDESPDGTRIACGTKDGIVQILDSSTLDVLREFRAHESATDALAFSPDGSRLVTGGDRQHVKVWDARTGERLVSFTSPASREFFSFVFSPDGKRLYIGSRHRDIRVCDAETGRELLQLKGHRSYVHELSLSPDGRVLASASGDNTVRFWDSRPLAERIEERDRVLAAEGEVASEVERMFGKLTDRAAVLRAIEAEPGFDALRRHAARNVALRRGE